MAGFNGILKSPSRASTYLDDLRHLLREYFKELDVIRDAAAVLPVGKVGEAVDERDDDVLDIDFRMELSTGLEERTEGLQVELVWEHLWRRER